MPVLLRSAIFGNYTPELFIKNADGIVEQFIITKLEYLPKNNFFIRLFITISIFNRHFLPEGEPISAHLLRCGGFAVDNHSFTRRRLVTGPISTRE